MRLAASFLVCALAALAACPRSSPPAQPAPPAIYPAPASLVASGGPSAHVTRACVDTSALAAHARLDALVPSVLADRGLALGGACDWSLAFAAGDPPVDAAARATWTASAARPQRYADGTHVDAAAHATTSLYAGTERAALYALRAAVALVDATGAAREATVVDAPAFASRGLVEGIYGDAHPELGTQYSPADRALLIRLVARLRGDTYVYGPKNDPWARAQWRDPYPATGAGNAQAIAAAASEADAQLVRFVWSLSPGADFDWASPAADTASAIAKLGAMRALGVHDFALFLDDNTKPASDAATIAAQAALANALDDDVKAHDPSSHLLLVYWHYHGAPQPGVDDVFGAHLEPDVEVMWTGRCVRSCTIAASDLAPVDDALGRHVSVWDNWPIDETDTASTPCCGVVPVRMVGRAGDVPGAAGGYYDNPVLNQAWALADGGQTSRPLSDYLAHVGPVFDYAWSAPRYDADASYAAWGALEAPFVAAARDCDGCAAAGWSCEGGSIAWCDAVGGCAARAACASACVAGSPPRCQ